MATAPRHRRIAGVRRRPTAPRPKEGKARAAERVAEYGQRVLQALKDGESTLQSVSHYELNEELGEGGMGTVFLADHVSEHGIRKPVAIKVLKETHDEKAIHRLIEEAALLAQLSQGTIVELLALESMEVTLPGRKNPRTGAITPPKKNKLYFMVQEYVNGPSLDEVLKTLSRNRLLMPPPLVGFILNKSVIALAEAHTLRDEDGTALNLAHRDISPGNILFMAKAGITKLADFGVAKAFGDFEEGEVDEKRQIVGKPRYMAPEQLDGNALPASDIWALGVIGYEALCGYAPYRVLGKGLRQQVANLRRQFEFELLAPAALLAPSAGHFDLETLSAIIMKCLSLDPQDRPTAQELNALLEGDYLYASGLGPTNKALSAYLHYLEMMLQDGEVMPPFGYESWEESKTLCATLHVDDATAAFIPRVPTAYRKAFLKAYKAKVANPCLLPDGETVFAPIA